MTLATYPTSKDNYAWATEFTSLGIGPLVCTLHGNPLWTPAEPGMKFHAFPGAKVPASDAAKRSREMKELSSRFKAAEHFRDQRFELRLLSQPIHRYSDPDTGLIDGALFAFAYGMNPEIVLLLEAQRDEGAEPAWNYSFVRVGSAWLHVVLDGQEIWTQRATDPSRDLKATYFLTTTTFRRPR